MQMSCDDTRESARQRPLPGSAQWRSGAAWLHLAADSVRHMGRRRVYANQSNRRCVMTPPSWQRRHLVARHFLNKVHFFEYRSDEGAPGCRLKHGAKLTATHSFA